MATRRQSGHLKKAFLEAYRETGNIRSACTAAGVGRSTIYKWQEHDGAFHAAFGQAQVEAVEALEAEAYRRGVTGVEEPVIAAGRGVVGTVRKYSDTLLIFLLKGAAPAKYRERYEPAAAGEREEVLVGYGDDVQGIAGDGLPA
jgi:hypothetical protein